MILALNKYAELYLFSHSREAESYLEAIDVQQDLFEFCDDDGQRYRPNFIIPPKVSLFGFVNVGAFELVPEGDIDSALPGRFLDRASQLQHSSVLAVASLEALRDELRKRAERD